MKIFKEYLLEAKNSSIPHLRHLAGESHYYNKEESDAEINRLAELHKHLTGQPSKVESISMKADGSPAFNMGYISDPETGESKFAVAYKGAARGFAYTHDDVDRLFAHNESLKNKMHQLLEHGHKVVRPQHGMIQGDFMGSAEDGTIKEEGDNIRFKENTINYGIDKKSDEGKALKKAKISVALHTRIDPENNEYNLTPEKFNKHNDVHVFNNQVFHDAKNYNETNQKMFVNNFNKAREHLSNIQDHNSLVFGLTDHLQTFTNNMVRQGKYPTTAGFKKHVQEKLMKEVEKAKSVKGKQQKITTLNNTMSHIDENKEEFNTLFKAHKHLDVAKNLLVDSLNSGKQHYIHEIDGESTHPEGYVVKYKGGNNLDNVVKVVNRQEFSRKNFQ